MQQSDFFSEAHCRLAKPVDQDQVKGQIERILLSYVFFNLSFGLLLAAECFYLFFNFAFLAQNYILAIHLSLIFATLFSFLILRLYFRTRKNEKIENLLKKFMDSCQNQVQQNENPHLLIARYCYRLAADLHGLEYHLYRLPAFLSPLKPTIEKFSCWCHWEELHSVKEQLLQTSIGEHIKLVRMAPTRLEVHAGLANAYVMLSGLYVDPRSVEGLDQDVWIPQKKYGEIFQDKFRRASEKAIEEFKILNDYAPNDPWVHTQLAYSYHDLQMPQEEIKEYEIIHQLCPEDKDNLFKLGRLYFQQGLNAKGLKVYESLKNANYGKADSLMQFYGTIN